MKACESPILTEDEKNELKSYKSMNLEHNFTKKWFIPGEAFTLNCSVCGIQLNCKTKDEICEFTTRKHHEKIRIFNIIADAYEK